ncbi:hypothetical protein OQJ68_13260 [Microbulbifer thermotolerans]|uniref:Uncharacterized protein n=1 Tax=Microbulbifer thermotolerans TaxID=252514 RepID=A0AB35I214_MICTH|nr:hypothetical protein [Microbulbifer thermotolerans]
MLDEYLMTWSSGEVVLCGSFAEVPGWLAAAVREARRDASMLSAI